jgi:DNA-binding NtrC family response regulator
MSDIHLLLVEDDRSLATLLQEYLSDAGYKVCLCTRGEEAIEKLQTEHFDLVLTDIVLPQVSGLCILDEASGNPASTLVILMTGYSGLEDAMHAVRKGAYDFISKPFQFPELCVRLDNAARYQALLRKWQAMDAGAGPRAVKESSADASSARLSRNQ